MTRMRHLALAITCSLACALAQAPAFAQGPTAAYNEAVRLQGGQRVVELPPAIRGYSKTRRPPVLDTLGGSRYMVETVTGLVQCTSFMFERESCEPSDFGRVVRWRTWVVKHQGQWQLCATPKSADDCQPALYVPKPGASPFPPRQPSAHS